ncbi:GNAT family N-acetyltransferase [Vagococcus bubulae]|uniref:N-acetyltransferase domain-containing protein n=1 Tax=Vagococcus bubulae TaxID=1977868 RepID=A0A429ZER8_9ENTE|nr:GNAT family N-acetyltransferase [Vagococcus bubulae]RST92202.1 hypothetical protein CBF36_08935 [Vagococcus bubulae]
MKKSQNLILTENTIMGTKRCFLRKITLLDVDDMYEYCSNKDVTKYTKFETHESKEETKEAIANIFIPDRLTKWGIELKQTKKLIGTIDWLTINEDSATLGYALSKEYWGQGIMPEVAQRMMQLAFEDLKLKVVYATHHKDNINSGKVMQKIGMNAWGKDYYFNFKGEPLVEIVKYGMTYDEYVEMNRHLL